MEDENELYPPLDEEPWEELELEPDSPGPLPRALPTISQLERRANDPPPIDLLHLPNDIISQIFYHACLPIAGDDEWRRPFYPLWLGKLCRAWRGIAWVTSELWTTVVLRVYHPKRAERSFKNQAKLLEEWLQRAKGRKLNVYFGEAKGNRAVALPLPLMELLVTRSSEQWQDVHICLSKNWERLLIPIAAPPSPSPISLPNLRSFVIQHSELRPSRIARANFSLAPSLRSLGLFNVPIHISDIAESFPCAQITQLTLSTRDHWKPQDLLVLFPRLRSLCIIDCVYLRTGPLVTHQKLQSLSIRSNGYEKQAIFFLTYSMFMKFPALKTLEVVYPWHINYTRYLLPFIERSSCHLTSLTLECLVCLEHDLIDLLFSLDTLVELYIRESDTPIPSQAHIETNERGLGRTFFDVLDPDEAAPFLPNLEVFLYKGLLCVQAIDFIEPFIVRSRMRGVQNAGIDGVALLKQATIIADQYSEVAEFSIAEYSDPQYIWEIVRMVEEGVLVLHNMDGSHWS